MSTDLEPIPDAQGRMSESLRTLATYLELALERGKCVVIFRRTTDTCSISIGDPADEERELKRHGAISKAVVDDLLGLTHTGLNRLSVGEQTYRFFRSFTVIDDVGAVVFTPT
ncbi:hypothetical protein AWB79_02046 [Caballeronia hypogeia]|uniref:Uncharacterized protein n=1 Tax=Caballeronia hypogeia TaxID=1777140 RepID=A0A158A7L1_9BURK|nr:hypothetical protein [Caballeronia hypogeia]SAK53675.1 hypothetical protein AWB79_02046 [Caballeronia hypogeia]